jgi:hypothetical protein
VDLRLELGSQRDRVDARGRDELEVQERDDLADLPAASGL